MSQENVEVIVRALEAYRAGGFAAGRGFLHPDFEMVRAGVHFTESGTYRGYDAASQSMLDYIDVFEGYRAEPEELIDAGDHVVLAQAEIGRARSSSVELRERWYAVFTLRDGKILRLQWFGERAEALEAAGLRE
ncbi:MAG TPA: nuclear transport factor 2 family protein [Solirubrobacteraceae bacterium]|jgi:ketosteroid isomerase-like protein|nr:nuclear transport factor 2 family protein [Solirubrobacteraceae bacterium]